MAYQTGYGGVYNPNPQKKTDGTYGYDPAPAVRSASTNGSPADVTYGQQNVNSDYMSQIPAASPGFVQPNAPGAPPQPQTVTGPRHSPMGYMQALGGASQFPSSAPPTEQPPGEMYGPGFGEQYGKDHVGQYDQKTPFEIFAEQQLNGNNPYYDRMRQQGEAGINSQLNARGHYNSGGAFQALGNFDAGLYADQFANMGNLLSGAASTGLQREGQGWNMAQGIQGLQQGRTGQQFSQLSDLSHLGAGINGQYYNQGGQFSGDAAMVGINAGANASGLQGQGQRGIQNFVYDVGKGLAFG